MGIRRCLVVARLDGGEGSLPRHRRRLARLSEFYAPFGTPVVSERYAPGAGALVAVIDFAGSRHDLVEPVTFGAELPSGLRSPGQLLDAGQTELRALVDPLAAVVADEQRVRLVTACSPPAMLYEAAGEGVQVWSSHAVAAAFLARGAAELDTGAVPELMAAQFVGGDRTLVAGARAVGTAVDVTLSLAGTSAECYWPAGERWAPLDPGKAHAHAERALLAGLPGRLEGYERRVCGLTGGLDSGVVAVALAELGIDFEALTFGAEYWPDVRTAPGIARGLGVGHRFVPIAWTGDDDALRAARAEARWHEGAIQLGIGRIPWPSGMSAWITGGGGETGRAFYYGERALRDPDPAPAVVTETLEAALVSRIDGAHDEARAAVRAAVAAWLADARSAGASGWSALDVTYAEQRLRRWLRGMMTHEVGVTIPAFTDPEVQRGLASLPLTDRVSSAFHRRFLEARMPELLSGRSPRRPGPARRALAILRRARRAPAASLLDGAWSEHPRFRAWVADEVLRSPALETALGEAWCEATRRRFLEGDGHAEADALWAAGPVALGAELRDVGVDDDASAS